MAREKRNAPKPSKSARNEPGPASAKPMYWVCTACGFAAADEEERQRHLAENQDDPAHREMIATELEDDELEVEEDGS